MGDKQWKWHNETFFYLPAVNVRKREHRRLNETHTHTHTDTHTLFFSHTSILFCHPRAHTLTPLSHSLFHLSSAHSAVITCGLLVTLVYMSALITQHQSRERCVVCMYGGVCVCVCVCVCGEVGVCGS